jgi:YbbR domain-containing protein
VRINLSPVDVVVPTDADVRVQEVLRPKAIYLDFDQKVQRKFRVAPAVSGDLPEGFFQRDEAQAVPESVAVFGPRRILDGMRAVDTVPLDVTGRRDNVEASRAIDLSGEYNLYAVPREVRVSVGIVGTRLVTVSGVPVVFHHQPRIPGASIEPRVAEVRISGPSHLVGLVGPDDIEVVVDAMGLPRGIHQVAADVVVPDKISYLSVEPELFTANLE